MRSLFSNIGLKYHGNAFPGLVFLKNFWADAPQIPGRMLAPTALCGGWETDGLNIFYYWPEVPRNWTFGLQNFQNFRLRRIAAV